MKIIWLLVAATMISSTWAGDCRQIGDKIYSFDKLNADSGLLKNRPQKPVAPAKPVEGKIGDQGRYFQEKQKYDAAMKVYNEQNESVSSAVKSHNSLAVMGSVLSVAKNYVLVTTFGGHKTLAVKNVPNQSKLVDGDLVKVFALPVGRQQYVDTAGAQATVPLYDCGTPVACPDKPLDPLAAEQTVAH
ncbi:MAG: hypothetical protein PCFJNLEI_00409 [Verrucomicrobiae bacterium]|nr:hypothetical protein [Verrucomicrobiae bacterium]